MCCRAGWADTSNGCDGTFGGSGYHACVLKPGKIFPSLNGINSLNYMYDIHLYMAF